MSDEKDRAIYVLSEFASALRAFMLADDDDKVGITQYKVLGARVKRAANLVTTCELAACEMQNRDRDALMTKPRQLAAKVKDSTQ
jgi:hypothetical protein